MFTPTDFLQGSVGCSLFILSIGASWSMISGAVFDASIAGAKVSINQKLQEVDRVAQVVRNEAQSLKKEPMASKLTLEAIEKNLEIVDREIEKEEKAIERDLDRFTDSEL